MNSRPSPSPPTCLALTMGDPSGIGPEICVKVLNNLPISEDVALTIVGDMSVLCATADKLNESTDWSCTDAVLDEPGKAAVLDLDNVQDELPAVPQPTADGGRASLDYIERAVREIQREEADGLVTSPISKEAIGAAGSHFPGHTEMLGALTDVERPVMLLQNESLRVAFATTHVAIRDVADQLSTELITHTGVALANSLRCDFGYADPVIALCALNPHSGDGGRFGDEESRVIDPAAQHISQQGFRVEGPLPSDTLYVRAINDEFDGVVAMYHDQGMIPIKLSGVGNVVNITLGLPFVRTSPGHGTAYDIAGQGKADVSSTAAAIRTAEAMVRTRKQHGQADCDR